MKAGPGEGSEEVGSQKAFPAGEKNSRFMLRSAGSPESFSGGGDEARGEQNHR